MFLEDENSEARPWFQLFLERGRMAFVGLFACAVMLVGLAATARAETLPPQPAGETAIALPLAAAPDAEGEAQAANPAPAVTLDPMPTGSTPLAAPRLVTNPAGLTLPRTETLSDRYILLGLMMVCFAAMAAGSLALWRRSLKELFRAETGRRRA
ncbi:MAG: hypothetical protein KJ670_10185 [Alphaproteobacteria bacterium]|nr:hypothetical protein [Rhizobiaceae bacterium]MBU3960459.1 hypothetical protein [Alphaproteobacteria bacterium]MBU4052658.1 hypothetical protein [Alphaproteobacteria bacterium]MBU4089077.1 hypothetical protein [Alphaproteobacteria bacterium]MBU4156684.1 hypothetical protein [Alphaproteobacteria bacterium]